MEKIAGERKNWFNHRNRSAFLTRCKRNKKLVLRKISWVNRTNRKVLSRAGELEDARARYIPQELTAAQQRRQEKQKKEQKKKQRLETAHPKPGTSIQLYHKRFVAGKKHIEKLLSLGTYLELHHVSRSIADLVPVEVSTRQTLDRLVRYERNKYGVYGFMFTVGSNRKRFVALKDMPEWTKFTVLEVAITEMDAPTYFHKTTLSKKFA